MRERCWYNRFHPTEPQCPKPGLWGKPKSESTFTSRTRWCIDHRHMDDEKYCKYCETSSADEVWVWYHERGCEASAISRDLDYALANGAPEGEIRKLRARLEQARYVGD